MVDEASRAWQTILRTEGAGFAISEMEEMAGLLRRWIAARKCLIKIFRRTQGDTWYSDEPLGDLLFESDGIISVKKRVADYLDACATWRDNFVNAPYRIERILINGASQWANGAAQCDPDYVPKGRDEIKVYLVVNGE